MCANTFAMWVLYALLSAVFAALVTIFAKIGMKGVDTDLATAIRTVVILVLAWSIAFLRGGVLTMGSLTKTNWLFLILSGLATGLSWIFYFKALQLGTVSDLAPIDKLSVALTLILAFIFLKEHMSARELIGRADRRRNTGARAWKTTLTKTGQDQYFK